MDFGTGRNRTASRRHNPAAGGDIMRFDEDIFDLMDNSYRENAIEVMNEWVKYPEARHLETHVKVLNEQIIEPVGKWLEIEWQKVTGNPNNYSHIEAAQKFKRDAEELAYRFKNNLTLLPEMIEVFDEKWREFQLQMGWGAIWQEAENNTRQQKKAKKPRNPELNKIIEKLAKRRDLIGNPWTAKNLWPYLYSMMEEADMVPEDMTTNQKQTKTWKIEYRKDQKSSNRTTLTYGTFQNKLSEARKKISR
jgi:hypothetical protein